MIVQPRITSYLRKASNIKEKIAISKKEKEWPHRKQKNLKNKTKPIIKYHWIQEGTTLKEKRVLGKKEYSENKKELLEMTKWKNQKE